MARLRAEAKSPYRGLRIFVYGVCGASGLIGAFIFLTTLLAGRASVATLPNFALQVGVVAVMVWLVRLEKRAEQRQLDRKTGRTAPTGSRQTLLDPSGCPRKDPQDVLRCHAHRKRFIPGFPLEHRSRAPGNF
jgi:hypothetical protein